MLSLFNVFDNDKISLPILVLLLFILLFMILSKLNLLIPSNSKKSPLPHNNISVLPNKQPE